MNADEIIIEILPDGTIKVTTDRISTPNHASADAFLREVGRLAGGETTIEKNHGSAHAHHHSQQTVQH